MESVFTLINVPLRCPNYSSTNKKPKAVDISIKIPIRGEIRLLAIDSTGLKVFGEGDMRKHGKDKRRVWRKLRIALDADTHQTVAAELSLSNVADSEVLPERLKQTHRKRYHQEMVQHIGQMDIQKISRSQTNEFMAVMNTASTSDSLQWTAR